MMRLSNSFIVTMATCLTACIAPPISVGNELDASSGSDPESDSSGQSSSSSGTSGSDVGTSDTTGRPDPGTSDTTGDPDSGTSSTGVDPGSTSSTSATPGSSDSTSRGTDTESTSSTSSTSSGSDTEDTGEPSPCDAGWEERTCFLAHARMPEGFGCEWVELERLEADLDLCTFEVSVGGRCIPTRYQGEGCAQVECGDTAGVYYRELSHGAYETFTNPGLCEYQPEEYTLCADGDDHEACQCVCVGDTASLPPDFEELLVSQGGCADLVAYAVDAEGTFALHTYIDRGLVAQAMEEQAAVETEIVVGEWTNLEVVIGQDLTNHFCNDVVSGTIQRRLAATAAVLHIVVEPGEGELATATVTLRDATFESEDGQEVLSIELYTFEDIAVGWLPG